MEDPTLEKYLSFLHIQEYKTKLTASTIKAALSYLKNYSNLPFPPSPKDIDDLLLKVNAIEPISTRIWHIRALIYYYATKLAISQLDLTKPIPDPYWLNPTNKQLIHPLKQLHDKLKIEEQIIRANKPKTKLKFETLIQARENAKQNVSSSFKSINAYIIFMFSTYGAPPRNGELGSTIFHDSPTPIPEEGNIFYLDEGTPTLLLRIHKNSRKRGVSSSIPVKITYPKIVYDEIKRIRPNDHQNNYLLLTNKPPIKSNTMNEAILQYLIDHGNPSKASFTNRDIRQAYAIEHPDMDPFQMLHTPFTHQLDYK